MTIEIINRHLEELCGSNSVMINDLTLKELNDDELMRFLVFLAARREQV